jgi:hypothetical protein
MYILISLWSQSINLGFIDVVCVHNFVINHFCLFVIFWCGWKYAKFSWKRLAIASSVQPAKLKHLHGMYSIWLHAARNFCTIAPQWFRKIKLSCVLSPLASAINHSLLVIPLFLTGLFFKDDFCLWVWREKIFYGMNSSFKLNYSLCKSASDKKSAAK